jgi:hypothetical protein
MFTIEERRKVQVALGLPRWELEDGSNLVTRLNDVIRFDQLWGTSLEIEIKQYLTEIDAMNAKIIESASDGSSGAVQTRQKIDEYSDTIIYGASMAASYQTRRADLIARLRIDLGYGLEDGAIASGVVPVR